MAFPPGFLDEVRARVSLSGLVGRRVQLKQRGRDDWWGLSPFVNEKSPSFHVREDKGFYHCFSSGEHGDHFSWLMKLEGLTFPEAVERLATDAGLDMPERTPEQKAADERRGGLTDATEAACSYFQRALRSEAGRDALRYLQERGLKDETIAAFRLGYAPGDGAAFKDAMSKAEISEQLLMETGLMRRPDGGRSPYAFFRDRIQFPILDARGRVIAFGGRFMGDAKAAGVGKYVNSPDTALFDKGRTLYNLQNARQAAHDGQTVLVVEGYMDVIALAEYGLEAAVAPLGTAAGGGVGGSARRRGRVCLPGAAAAAAPAAEHSPGAGGGAAVAGGVRHAVVGAGADAGAAAKPHQVYIDEIARAAGARVR